MLFGGPLSSSYKALLREPVDAPESSNRLRAGDLQTFDELFCCTYPGLLRFATRLTQSRETAEDVVMEIFRKVWERRAVWHPDDPRVYLYGAVRNGVATEARNRNTRHALLSRVMDEGSGIARAQAAPDIALEEEEWCHAFTQIIKALPDRQQRVLTLRREHGLTNAAVASALRISIKTVEKDLTAAFKVLRVELAAFR